MNELLLKIYSEVIQYEADSIELGKTLDDEANQLLEPYKEKFGDDDLESIRALMYNLAYEAERMGYELGVKFVVQMLIELFVK